jgi:capsid protein
VIAINIVPKQDDRVTPFLTENHYTFTAYKANNDIKEAYGVDGAPMEFVIDRQGRAVMTVRLASDQMERQFGELVEKLWREWSKHD